MRAAGFGSGRDGRRAARAPAAFLRSRPWPRSARGSRRSAALVALARIAPLGGLLTVPRSARQLRMAVLGGIMAALAAGAPFEPSIAASSLSSELKAAQALGCARRDRRARARHFCGVAFAARAPARPRRVGAPLGGARGRQRGVARRVRGRARADRIGRGGHAVGDLPRRGGQRRGVPRARSHRRCARSPHDGGRHRARRAGGADLCIGERPGAAPGRGGGAPGSRRGHRDRSRGGSARTTLRSRAIAVDRRHPRRFQRGAALRSRHGHHCCARYVAPGARPVARGSRALAARPPLALDRRSRGLWPFRARRSAAAAALRARSRRARADTAHRSARNARGASRRHQAGPRLAARPRRDVADAAHRR